MRWSAATLGELIDIKHGFAFRGENFASAGEYILLTPGNCHEGGGLKLKGEKEKYYVGEIPDEYLLSAGDLLVVMTDLVNTAPILGGSLVIPEDGRYLHNQRLGLVTIADPTRIHKKFLYYLFNTSEYRGQVRGSASGATVRHTSPDRIKRCRVMVPETIAAQLEIAGILSAYDDLIENNRRRILLLEQAARLLYKEWFVQLRFPGREHVKIKDGVPEGWEKKPLGALLTLQRGFDLPTSQRKDGPFPIYASTGINGHHAEAKVKGPGVVTGRSGSLGAVMFISEDFWPLNTTLWVKEFRRVGPRFATYLLESMRLAQYNGGAAVPTLNRNDVHRVEVLSPPPVLLRLFEDYASDFLRQIALLNRIIIQLENARELLLPRLMTGEIAA